MASGFLVFLWLATGYMLSVYFLAKRGLLAKWGMGLWGPAVMLKTTRGRDTIEKLAKPRKFWNVFSDVGMVVTLVLMVVLVGFLIFIVPFLTRVPASAAPRASEILAIPGINPLIPLWYGLVALVIAIVIHEFAHGILARANDLKVKSLGLLFLVVPIGAFVEPDEEELKGAKKRRRMRVYAAGVSANLATALVFGLLFSGVVMASTEPVTEGVGIVAVVAESPAHNESIERGWVLTAIDGLSVSSSMDFQRHMCGKEPGEEVRLSFHQRGERTVTLADRADFEGTDTAGIPMKPEQNRFCPQEYNQTFIHKGFLGVQNFDIGGFRALMVNPLQDGFAFVSYVSLPFTFTTFAPPVTDWFDAPFHAPTFWVIANVLYWIFWISLMLGLTNALPAVPLDGGALFRDVADSVIRKVRPGLQGAARERAVRITSTSASLLVLGLILAQLIVPRLGLAG